MVISGNAPGYQVTCAWAFALVLEQAPGQNVAIASPVFGDSTVGGILRWFVQRRVKAEAADVLLGLKQRLEAGEPPLRATRGSR